MKIAVEVCCHGELDAIYADLQGNNVDLRYYSGEIVAPILTVFIGGNHECSSYLQELPYGGWVAPNIYYMGLLSGVQNRDYTGYVKFITFAGIRIAGVSGVYERKTNDYYKGHFERPPYNNNTIHSAYNMRNIEIFRLKQISRHLDIFISHDWPQHIDEYGDTRSLIEENPFLKSKLMQTNSAIHKLDI